MPGIDDPTLHQVMDWQARSLLGPFEQTDPARAFQILSETDSAEAAGSQTVEVRLIGEPAAVEAIRRHLIHRFSASFDPAKFGCKNPTYVRLYGTVLVSGRPGETEWPVEAKEA